MLAGIIKSIDDEKIVIEDLIYNFTRGVIDFCKINNIAKDLKCMPFVASEQPKFQYECGLHYKQKVNLVVKIPELDDSKREYLKSLIDEKTVCMQCKLVCVDNRVECVLFGDVMLYEKCWDKF